jgi:uncharacterized membrane protein
MKHEDILAKAEQEKIKAKLQQAKAKLDEMDATARQQKAQAVIDAIVALRVKRDEIQTSIQQFNDASDARALQIKAEIEGKLANFEDALSKLVTKLKSQSTTAK